MALSRTSLAGIAVAFVASTGQASEGQAVYSRFGYCSAPLPPACASDIGAAASSPACRAEAEAYVASVFKYRECLAAEMQRAVREANTVIDAMRCASDHSLCAVPDGASAKKP